MNAAGNSHTRFGSISRAMAHALMIAEPNGKGLLGRFADDQSGSNVIIFALLMPVLIGAAGLGTEPVRAAASCGRRRARARAALRRRGALR